MWLPATQVPAAACRAGLRAGAAFGLRAGRRRRSGSSARRPEEKARVDRRRGMVPLGADPGGGPGSPVGPRTISSRSRSDAATRPSDVGRGSVALPADGQLAAGPEALEVTAEDIFDQGQRLGVVRARLQQQ